MKKKLYQMCCDIIDEAYPEAKDSMIGGLYKGFRLSLQNRNLKTKHGDYFAKTRTIRVFNLERGSEAAIKTAIHELAHHVTLVRTGHLDHSSFFYDEYEKLLSAAIRMGILSFFDLELISDGSSDYNKIMKRIRALNPAENIVDYKQDVYIFKVRNSFDFKEKLKERNYSYDALQKLWWKEIDKEHRYEEELYLRKIIKSQKDLEITEGNQFTLDVYKKIIVHSGFEIRDFLRGSGYRYDGRNRTWAKRVLASELEEEMKKIPKKRSSVIEVVGC